MHDLIYVPLDIFKIIVFRLSFNDILNLWSSCWAIRNKLNSFKLPEYFFSEYDCMVLVDEIKKRGHFFKDIYKSGDLLYEDISYACIYIDKFFMGDIITSMSTIIRYDTKSLLKSFKKAFPEGHKDRQNIPIAGDFHSTFMAFKKIEITLTPAFVCFKHKRSVFEGMMNEGSLFIRTKGYNFIGEASIDLRNGSYYYNIGTFTWPLFSCPFTSESHSNDIKRLSSHLYNEYNLCKTYYVSYKYIHRDMLPSAHNHYFSTTAHYNYLPQDLKAQLRSFTIPAILNCYTNRQCTRNHEMNQRAPQYYAICYKKNILSQIAYTICLSCIFEKENLRKTFDNVIFFWSLDERVICGCKGCISCKFLKAIVPRKTVKQKIKKMLPFQ
jgi:hypothetical protein